MSLDERRSAFFAITLLASTCVGCPGRRTNDGAIDTDAIADVANDAPPAACGATPSMHDTLTFHRDRERLGWDATETDLTPEIFRNAGFGSIWNSPQLDSITIGTRTYEPHLYATPLYADALCISSGPHAGSTLRVVFAATSNGFAYAIHAGGDATLEAGAILWRRQLGNADVVATLDGGMPMGVLSTPVLDLTASPPRLYVTSMDATAGWQAFALDARSGDVLPGWPVTIDASTVAPVNRNGPATWEQDARVLSQRGALNLSRDGGSLYVPFGAYYDGGVGWLVAIDTRTPRVSASFSGAPSDLHEANGGIWGPGGVSIDDDGTVCATTGNSPVESHDAAHVWGQSLLCFDESLHLRGTFTPFNYCDMDVADTDLGGSSPVLVPAFDPSRSSVRRLMAFGGKQGTVYLVDRDHLPGSLDHRPACSTDSSTDPSFLPPEVQPQFGARGPLNVFGPYSELYGNLDRAKMRSTPAYFRDANGRDLLFVSGSTKAAIDSMTCTAPSLARLVVNTSPTAPPHLAIDRYETSIVFLNPGSPIVTSDGSMHPIVWVLDENARRVASLVDPAVPHPILYAVDGDTMTRLWSSTDDPRDALFVGGKYSSATIARGIVFVGTDRIQAFGVRP